MNKFYFWWGIVLLAFSILIILIPNVFNIGSIIGIAIIMIIHGLVEKKNE